MIEARKEKALERLVLTKDQERVAKLVLTELRCFGPQSVVIVAVEGVSGIGKTTLLNRIRSNIADLGGKVLGDDEVLPSHISGPLVASFLPARSLSNFSGV